MRQFVENQIELIGQSAATYPQGLSHTTAFGRLFFKDDFMSKQIPLTQGKFAIIDDEDYDKVSQYKWRTKSALNGQFYATSLRGWISMHRLVMGCVVGDKKQIDHKDHNGLNNQKSNLRIATGGQNNMNARKCLKHTTSKYKGVHWNKKDRRFHSQIRKNGELFFLGGFRDEIEAAKTYDAKAKELFGEFACLNLE